ncbi:hypothetical protein GP5015_828 [gamma proteobacterium HTCC5015]|nr:hypothetical protein GP5015_828 [gamma proteobacterium HTCC5015]
MNTWKALLLATFIGLFAHPVFAQDSVNINTATAEQLAEHLDGIGPAKAQAIVAFRQANGPFSSADQLVEVKGIGLRTLESNRDAITTSE